MASTFVDVLGERAAASAGLAFEFVDRSGTAAVGYPELETRARTIGATLADRGLTGRRVLVLLPPGLDYVAVLLGCLYAGAVAVPVPPLPATGPLPARQRAVLADAAPDAAIVPPGTDTAALDVTVLSTADLFAFPAGAWRRPDVGPDTLALLQYPSGPADPHGVMVSHANLLASCRQLTRQFGADPDAGVVSWQPPYQGMGLLAGVLHPIVAGRRATLLDPREFRADPARWLRLISDRHARISGGPGAAFDLCGGLADDELTGLDLSSWDTAFTDAAPATMDRFADRLARTGFRRRAFFPCYWLAEATSLVAGRRAPAVTSFDADSLAPGRLTKPRSPGTPVIDRGRPADEVDVAIVDPLTATRCPDGTAGEIWVSGPTVAVGYLGKPEASERTFCARLHGSTDNYLRTGDLGFLHDGGLHVTDLAA
ncbi:MAG TPA: AMP-binding protein [Actinophytocola sp.]|nr:AMP-binding protein [Actinophytocola sp.]